MSRALVSCGRRTAGVAVGLVVFVAALVGGAGRAATGDIVEFPTFLGPDAGPWDIAAAPDGKLWFTEIGGNLVGSMTTTGTEIDSDLASNSPNQIAVGKDGNLWFTEPGIDMIGKVKRTTLAVTEFPSTAGSSPAGITAGGDGKLWFTEQSAGRIGRITTGGVISHITLFGSPAPMLITAGPDGNLWFTESGGKIGRINTAGTGFVEFPVPSGNNPNDIAPGPDGNVWFTEPAGNMIGRITPTGTVTEFPIPTNGEPRYIGPGPDGNVWFTEFTANKIGRITPTGTVTEYPIPTGQRPTGIASGPDGNVWALESRSGKVLRVEATQPMMGYAIVTDGGVAPKTRSLSKQGTTMQWMFVAPRPHSVVVFDSTGTMALGLFDSGPLTLVSYFTFTFTAAGSYSYKSTVAGDGTPFTGTIKVPIKVKLVNGMPNTATITWATVAASAPFVYDVQVKQPSGSSFLDWKTGVAAGDATFGPGDPLYVGAGTYQFQARLRNTGNGAASGYSAPKSISLS